MRSVTGTVECGLTSLLLGILVSLPIVSSPSSASSSPSTSRPATRVSDVDPRYVDARLVLPDEASSLVWPDDSLPLSASAISSPGIVAGATIWDAQHSHSQGYQVGKNSGEDIVHFAWKGPGAVTEMGPDTMIMYNAYSISSGTFAAWTFGLIVTNPNNGQGAHPGLAVGQSNDAHIAFHQRLNFDQPSTTWMVHVLTPGDLSNYDDSLPTPPEYGELLWPRLDVQQNPGGTDVYHVLSHVPPGDPSERIVYWRFAGTVWEGPVVVDSNALVSYVLAADPNSNKVAMVLHSAHAVDGLNGMRNVAYYESQSEGAGWIDGSELGAVNKTFITGYSDPLGPEAWVHLSSAYDGNGVLHVIWDEQRYANVSTHNVIRHWNDLRQTSTYVAFGYWDNPKPNGVYSLNLAKMTVGIGDGSTPCTGGPGDQTNRDYLYVLYTQFGGPTAEEQSDYSSARTDGYVGEFMNGELYMAVSPDQGNTWSVPVNLTNTKSPGCDPKLINGGCSSEHWGSIARTVDDINIAYIHDLDAGSGIDGEGYPRSNNRLMYLRFPGATPDAQYLCPEAMVTCICLCHGDPECDGEVSVLDVVKTVDVAFRGGSPIPDPNVLCSTTDTDVSCDGVTSVTDVVKVVNVAFRNFDPAAQFCDPCNP